MEGHIDRNNVVIPEPPLHQTRSSQDLRELALEPIAVAVKVVIGFFVRDRTGVLHPA